MKTIFVDCNDQLRPVYDRVFRPGDDPAITVNYEPFDREKLPEILAGYDIVLNDHTFMPTEQMKLCTSLKHVVFLGTGAASYMDVAALEAMGQKVHTIKGYGDTAVAEHTIALMWAAARDLARMDRQVRAGEWITREGPQLTGKTLGLIGLGGIGGEVARIAAGMGMRVLAFNRTPRQQAGVTMASLDEVLAQADVLSINLVLSNETENFLNAERIAKLKPGCIFVNTARAALVDEKAMIAALESGQIRHAGLDVFHEEPLPKGHPLTKLDNVTLSAHSGYRTPDASETLIRRAIDIARSVIKK
ncbi:glycerate dehydrogenase [Variibacter gotjawalensis]|uniref:Glycerate dehydrogenase n=1 Tax=Variibacter gotjawalensis TaxID=1333996 RepID=A0A0S3PR75_9BRAD|nr:NAD(P)-dependent oxidoreductase [Variibacter gotjawalensis]NIK48686.1 D-3-phosphoglycerate dehydrogenase [Variibacter gotjawalensis]RZS50547.1 D-3-phosphoglycerate dehydrogenase [Variibacter gotjawalensis]BAT58381.1 glycerate dehydrogenase [Variibacter gotjawalensis]